MPGTARLELPLFETDTPDRCDLGGLGITFRDSKDLPIHGWYPYVEGFSAAFIRNRLSGLRSRKGSLYDPFGGSGTVNVEASHHGVNSSFSELNPFMRLVAETKTSSVIWARKNMKAVTAVSRQFNAYLASKHFQSDCLSIDLSAYERAFPERDFFEEQHIRELLAAKMAAEDFCGTSKQLYSIILLAISSELVSCSNMTRRADLRRRKPGEYKNRIVDVRKSVSSKLTRMISDITKISGDLSEVNFVSNDARKLDPIHEGRFDEIITSPPYLNGTNYFRNTKIELWFTGFIESENDLPAFNASCVACGINNVSKSKKVSYTNENIQKITSLLKESGGDQRIARLVELYFSDMHDVVQSCHRYLKKDGAMSLDIGDSKFYGVYVPVDQLLAEMCKELGFELIDSVLIARRHSRDKTPLKQVEIILKKVH
jgi:hypothetical protein